MNLQMKNSDNFKIRTIFDLNFQLEVGGKSWCVGFSKSLILQIISMKVPGSRYYYQIKALECDIPMESDHLRSFHISKSGLRCNHCSRFFKAFIAFEIRC